MSSKARRFAGGELARPFDWNGTAPRHQPPPPVAVAPPLPPPAPAVDAAQIERDAFMKGYAQGERAGAEAAAARGEAVVRRLSDTVDELRTLRTELLQKAEHQVVHLALAIARRLVHREVTLDPDLVAAMGRVAIERLNTVATATIHLHPDDYAAVVRGGSTAEDGPTSLVADPMVRRGGCLVHSDFGIIDVGVDAQIQEIARTLFGDSDREGPPPGLEVHGAR